MEVNKPGGPVAPTAPVHFFQSLVRGIRCKSDVSRLAKKLPIRLKRFGAQMLCHSPKWSSTCTCTRSTSSWYVQCDIQVPATSTLHIQ